MRKRLESLERQLRDGAARLLEVPPGLVPELAKALETVREERDAVAAQREGLGKRRPSKSVPRAIVDEMMVAARDLKKAAKACKPALINHCFRRLGVEIVIKQNTAEAVDAEVRILSTGDSMESRGCSQRLTIRHFLVENVRLPPSNPPGFQKGNKCGRGLPPDKARQASLARWRRKRGRAAEPAAKAKRRHRSATVG
jgi:hypothetical protein